MMVDLKNKIIYNSDAAGNRILMKGECSMNATFSTVLVLLRRLSVEQKEDFIKFLQMLHGQQDNGDTVAPHPSELRSEMTAEK